MRQVCFSSAAGPMEYLTEYGYPGLFVAAFLAATILPLSSEVVLSVLLLNGLPPGVLVLVATVGNVLGSLTNYLLGYWIGRGVTGRRSSISSEAFEKARHRLENYGVAALLLAWVPVIGDPITVVAGVLRIPLAVFVILVSVGKCVRYVVVAYLALQTM